jgi:hypothetical protein
MARTWGIAATLFVVWSLAAVTCCAGPQPSSMGAATVPASITKIGELGKDIYDLANQNEWTKLFNRLDLLNKATDELDTNVTADEKVKRQLFKSITDLEESAEARGALGAMQAANQIMLIAADLAEPFHPPMPVDVARLHYYGRELQIWSQDKQEAKLEETAEAFRESWTNVRSVVSDHGGTAEAERLDALVRKLGEAKSSDEYSTIVTPILDEVDNVEKLFAE